MSTAVVKDCSEIWARLFDHRPFLNGEIKLFLKNFEESRSDQKADDLLKIFELVTDINDNQVQKVEGSLGKLQKLHTLLDISLTNCGFVLEETNNTRTAEPQQQLLEKRAMRQADYEKFLDSVESQYSQINQTFKEKEEDLKEFYRDLEEKLHVGSSPS